MALRAIVLQPEHCGDLQPGGAISAAEAGSRWLIDNQQDDGSYLYRYDRVAEQALGGYNTVRHAGVIATLEQAATLEIEGAAAAADRGTTWAKRRTAPLAGGTALADGNEQVTVGASALWAIGLVERRHRTDDPVHDTLLVELGRFMRNTVQPDGSVPGRYDRASGDIVPGSWSKFYTGEAFWALALLHPLFPDEGFGDAAERIANYLPDRDRAEDWWPPIPDHWAAYGFAAMTAWPEPPVWSERQREYIERQTELQSLQIRYESTRTDSRWTHLTRGRPTLGAGLGTIGEALNQWWVVVQSDVALNQLAPVVAERARCVAGLLAARQAPPDRSGQEAGAWFQFDITQMDDQQHSINALINVVPILEATP